MFGVSYLCVVNVQDDLERPTHRAKAFLERAVQTDDSQTLHISRARNLYTAT